MLSRIFPWNIILKSSWGMSCLFAISSWILWTKAVLSISTGKACCELNLMKISNWLLSCDSPLAIQTTFWPWIKIYHALIKIIKYLMTNNDNADQLFMWHLIKISFSVTTNGMDLDLCRTYPGPSQAIRVLKTIDTAADPGGGPRGPGPPPDPRFWGPKIEHFAALFNFSIIFFASLRSAYYFFNMLLFHSSNWKIFQPRFTRHVFSHLQVLVSHILGY